MSLRSICFFNDTATTEIYTLSLHDALPISCARQQTDDVATDGSGGAGDEIGGKACAGNGEGTEGGADRKSTRLNSSHANISYAVFCLKKKKSYHPSYLQSLQYIVYLLLFAT